MLRDPWRCKTPACIPPSLLCQVVPSRAAEELLSCFLMRQNPSQGRGLPCSPAESWPAPPEREIFNEPNHSFTFWTSVHTRWGNSHYSSIHRLNMDVPHLNKYGDVLWAGQDISENICPSLFLPFPPHILPLQCNTGLFLMSWRPADNHNQKIQLLPMELFFYLPAPQVAGCCYSHNCWSFN